MNSENKGELRLADGTLVRTVEAIDFELEYDSLTEPSDFPRYDPREAFNRPSQACGTFTLEGIDALIDMIRDDYIHQEVYYYVPKQRYWGLQYLAQGKRYPNPRKRKSQAWIDRISKKMRNRA